MVNSLIQELEMILREMPELREIIRYLAAKGGYQISSIMIDMICMMMTAVGIFLSVRWLIRIICWWRVFRKAGYSSWLSIIPIVSKFCKYSIGWEWAGYIIYLISTVLMAVSPKWFAKNAVVFLSAGLLEGNFEVELLGTGMLIMSIMFLMMPLIRRLLETVRVFKLRRGFGKSVWFGFGLLFFNTIFMMILAFGSAEYNEKMKYKKAKKTKTVKKQRSEDKSVSLQRDGSMKKGKKEKTEQRTARKKETPDIQKDKYPYRREEISLTDKVEKTDMAALRKREIVRADSMQTTGEEMHILDRDDHQAGEGGAIRRRRRPVVSAAQESVQSAASVQAAMPAEETGKEQKEVKRRRRRASMPVDDAEQ